MLRFIDIAWEGYLSIPVSAQVAIAIAVLGPTAGWIALSLTKWTFTQVMDSMKWTTRRMVDQVVHNAKRLWRQRLRFEAAWRGFRREPMEDPKPQGEWRVPKERDGWPHEYGELQLLQDWSRTYKFKCLPEDVALLICEAAIINGHEIAVEGRFSISARRTIGVPFTGQFNFATMGTNHSLVQDFRMVTRRDMPLSLVTAVKDWISDPNTPREDIRQLCKQLWRLSTPNWTRHVNNLKRAIIADWNEDQQDASGLVRAKGERDIIWYIATYANNNVAGCWAGTEQQVPDEATEFVLRALERWLPEKPARKQTGGGIK